jgi:hypothetical protein
MNIDISDTIIESHRQLSQANLRFLDFVQQNPGTLERSHFNRLLQLNVAHIRMQPWPTFIDRACRQEIETAAVGIFNLIKTIPLRMFDNNREKISRYYEIPMALVNFFMTGIENGDDLSGFTGHLTARGDYVYTSSGFKCIEYNVSPNFLGLEATDYLGTALSVPMISTFMEEQHLTLSSREIYLQMFRHIVETARKKLNAADIRYELNAAMISPGIQSGQMYRAEERFNDPFKRFLRQEYPGLLGHFFACDYHHLEVNKNDGALTYNGHPIHVVQELYKGFVPADILALMVKGKVLILDGPISPLLGNKLTIALLSEGGDNGTFDSEECQLIKKHIPWTRKITPGETFYDGDRVRMEEFLLSHRERLVIKPSIGYGGFGVFIGAATAEDRWKQVVATALAKRDWQNIPIHSPITVSQWGQLAQTANQMGAWVVQEYSPSRPYLYQSGTRGCCEHEAVWGFIVLGSLYAGGVIRTLPKKEGGTVINSHQGAEISLILEVE